MGRPTAGWGSINCAGAGQPGRVWQARTAPRVAMLPGEAGINVRKTARYAGKDCDPLHDTAFCVLLPRAQEPSRHVLRQYDTRDGWTQLDLRNSIFATPAPPTTLTLVSSPARDYHPPMD